MNAKEKGKIEKDRERKKRAGNKDKETKRQRRKGK
jgi:hypothetical protein